MNKFKEMLNKKLTDHLDILVYCEIDRCLMWYDFPVEEVYYEENEIVIEGDGHKLSIPMDCEIEYDDGDDTYGIDNKLWLG